MINVQDCMINSSLILIGAGNSTIEIIDFIHDLNQNHKKKIKIVGILDDNKNLHNKKISGVKVIGSLNDIKKYKKHHFF